MQLYIAGSSVHLCIHFVLSVNIHIDFWTLRAISTKFLTCKNVDEKSSKKVVKDNEKKKRVYVPLNLFKTAILSLFLSLKPKNISPK